MRFPGPRALVTVLLMVVTSVLAGSSSAVAEPPVDVSGPITDAEGVLGNQSPRVQTALDDYFEATRSQLFVVYVDSFDGLNGQEWAAQSAETSGLGAGDVLFAVATGDRAYGYSVDERFALSNDQIEQIVDDRVLPSLRARDWAGASVGFANGLTDASSGIDLPWGLIAIGGVVVVGGGAFAVTRIRRRYDRTHDVRDEHGNPVDPVETLSTEELDRRSGTALVAIDDALKTSAQELAYAEAQFGREATRAFAEALATAQETVRSAFELRQRLDDSTPETEEERRRLAAEIVRRCTQADTTLDEQVEAFDRLRDLQARAPEVLADLVVRADEIERRLVPARATVELLQRTHPASDLASVVGNADQAEQLVHEARRQCELGQQSVSQDDRPTAVVRARAAEDAVGQAVTLLDAIDRADQDLTAAPALIAQRLTSITQDVADAKRLAPDDPAVVTAVEAAEQAVEYAGRTDHDPLAAAAYLQSAEAELDDLLGPARAAAEEAEKARTALVDSLGRVTSRVTAVTDYVATRRGAVGPQARTLLSEASRHLDQARQLAESDPGRALTELHAAEQQVGQAEQAARSDVEAWERSQQPRSSGGGLNSMVLGGILFDQMSRGGLGGGSVGRSNRSGGLRPGSFGGGGTRGRRGGGGRF